MQAVQREMVEEAGLEVQVGNLLFVREYIGKHHENAETESHFHVIDHLFHCFVEHVPETFLAKAPDPSQEEIEWLSLNQLMTCRFYPQALLPHLIELGKDRVPSTPVYVGDIN